MKGDPQDRTERQAHQPFEPEETPRSGYPIPVTMVALRALLGKPSLVPSGKGCVVLSSVRIKPLPVSLAMKVSPTGT